jgi:subtilisin family serine protease
MDLVAPAVEIVSTVSREVIGSGYSTSGGTSDATAIVAGAAALVRSRFPTLSASEVVHRLTATAIDRGAPGRDPDYGYGIVNLVGALTADVPRLNTPSAHATESSTSGATTDGQGSGARGEYLLVGVGTMVLLVLAVSVLVSSHRRI